MNKNLLLAFGITILFLGLSVQPSIATVQPEQRIPAIIRNKDNLNRLIERLSDLPCDCENDITNGWFPGNIILCYLLYALALFGYIVMGITGDFTLLVSIMELIEQWC